jgi:hypothetical protein
MKNITKYHAIYQQLKELGNSDYQNFNDKKNKILTSLKEVYDEYLVLGKEKDFKGKWGIRFSTVGDDSKYADEFDIFFDSKTKRNNIFDDWKAEKNYDNIFDTPIAYPLPGPNLHGLKKIFKENKKIYEE